MSKGKSTWKYNKLLTARSKYYNFGGTINVDASSQVGQPGSDPGIKAPTNIGSSEAAAGGDSGGGGGMGKGAVMQAIIATAQQHAANLGYLTQQRHNDFMQKQQNEAYDYANTQKARAVTEQSQLDLNKAKEENLQITNTLKEQALEKQNEAFFEPKEFAIGGLISAGLQLDSAAGKAIAGDYNSGAGRVIQSIPGMGIIGGAISRLSGIKTNQAEVNRVKGDNTALANAANAAAAANSFDSSALSGPTNVNFNVNAYKGGAFSKGKAQEKNRRLSEQLKTNAEFANRTIDNSISNIADNQLSNAESTFVAAFGGELNTQGGDFTNGMINIDKGGSHESNPLDGVPIGMDERGVPNLVEEGETIFNDYVFSRRLKVPKAIRKKYKLRDNISFADASKKLAKESEERPNDPISKNGLIAFMSNLARAQEELKYKKMGNKFSHGGNILAEGTNSLNDPYGYYEYPDSEPFFFGNDIDGPNYNYDSQTDYFNSIMDYYQSNESSQNKGEVNISPISTYEPTYTNDGAEIKARIARDKELKEKEDKGPLDIKKNRYRVKGTGEIINDYFPGRNSRGETWFDLNPGYELVDEEGTIRDPEVDEDGNNVTYTDYFLKKKEDKERNFFDRLKGMDASNLRYAPAVGYGISALTDALGITNKPDYSNADSIIEAAKRAGTYDPVKFKPIGNYLTYKPFDRDYYINKMNAEAGATRRNIMNTSGGNRATAMAGLLAADNNYLNQLGNLARQAEEYNFAQRAQVEEFNRGTNNTNSQGFLQADLANQKAASSASEISLKGLMAGAEMKDRIKTITDANKSANLSGLFQTLGDIGYEEKNKDMANYTLDHELWGVGAEDGYTFRRKNKKNARNIGVLGAYGGKIKKKRKNLTLKK